jgi:hypothetical protein
MEIRTADRLGRDAIMSHVQNSALTRKILALANYRIRISEAVLEMMEPESPTRPVLEVLLKNQELKKFGSELTQEDLETLLARIILDQIADKDTGVDENSNFAEICQAAELELPIRLHLDDATESSQGEVADDVIEVETVDRFVIIATDDEVDIAGSQMMLVRHEQTSLATTSPWEFMQSDAGKARLQAMVEDRMTEMVANMFDLPTITDPDEFEQTLEKLSLSPVMQQGDNARQFVEIASTNFARRPSRSRRAIAKVLQHHGLPRSLAENIVFLCSKDRTEALQTEAIGMVVRYISPKELELSIMLAAVSLVKLIEEDGKVSVRLRTLEVLQEKISTITEQLPQFVDKSGLVPLLKTMLIEDPDNYREPVRDLLRSLGQACPEDVSRDLQRDLDTIHDDFALVTYLEALEATAGDMIEQQDIATRKWQLFLKLYADEASSKKQLALSMWNDLKAGLPDSLDLLFLIFHNLDTAGQITMVNLLDDLFLAAIESGTIQDREIIKKVSGFFLYSMADEAFTPDTQFAVLKTKTIMNRILVDQVHTKMWTFILPAFPMLCRDETFVERFIEVGEVMFCEFIAQLSSQKAYENAPELLEIAHKKLAELRCRSKRVQKRLKNNLVTAVNQLGAMTVASIKADRSVETMMNGFVTVMNCPLLSGDQFIAMFIAFRKATANKDHLKPRLLSVYIELCSSKHLIPEIAEGFVELLLITIKEEEPQVPGVSEDIRPLTDQMTAVFRGIKDLLANASAGDQNHSMLKMRLTRLRDARPDAIELGHKDPLTEKWVPPRPIDDPFMGKLVSIVGSKPKEE